MAIVTLTTDYGTRDYYAAALNGVIRAISAKAEIVTITHDVPPFAVLHGAFLLRQVWLWYPAGTVHLAVVDPGVGSNRRLIAGQYEGRYLLAPDNGLATLVHRDLKAEAMHVIDNPRFALPTISRTFHGRDILAPAAAHLANGVRLRELGPATDHIELLNIAHRAKSVGPGLVGQVLYVDRFGTLVTNVRGEQLGAPRILTRPWEVRVGTTTIGPVRASFHEVPPGELVALLGSSGALEIAVNQGSAVERLGTPWELEVRVE